MQFSQDLRIIFSCYVFYIFLNVFFILTAEITSSTFSWLFMPIILFVVIKALAIPRPSDTDLQAILGVDVWLQYKESLLLKNDNIAENGSVFRTIAHRAAALDAPENSIAALKRCKSKGCYFVEIDISLTKDGVPIVFHDNTLDRLLGVPGNVQDFLWEELKDYNLIFQPDVQDKDAISNEKIALFDDFIDMCIKLGVKVFIDLKGRKDEVVKVVLDAYEKHPSLYKSSLVTSFNSIILYKIRKSNPKIVCSMAWRPDFFLLKTSERLHLADKRCVSFFLQKIAVILDKVSTWLIFNFVYYLLGLSVILIHKDALNVEIVSMWQKRNVRVIAWTVNSKIEKDYFAEVLHIPYMTDSLDYCHINTTDDSKED